MVIIKLGGNTPYIYFKNIINDIINSNISNININRLLLNYINLDAVISNIYWSWDIDVSSLDNNEIETLKTLTIDRMNYYFNNKYINYYEFVN